MRNPDEFTADKPMARHDAGHLSVFIAVCAIAGIALLAPEVALAQPVVDEPAEDEVDPFAPNNRSGFLGYSLSVSPQLTYSDNVTLAPEGSESEDGLASVEFTGGLLIDRVNFTGIVNGRLEVGSYLDPASENGQELYDQFIVDQNIRSAATAEFVDNLLYLDLAASTERRALDERSQFSQQSIAANERQATSYSYSVSPYLRTEFSNRSTVAARYRFIDVKIDDEDAAQGVDNFLNDSQSQEVVAEYTSGRLLDRLSFSLRAYAAQTQEQGSDVLPEVDFDQNAYSGSVRYPLSRKLSAVGTIGYDDIDTNNNPAFDDDELSGVFWKAGLLATPGRRTRAQLEVGERYGGTLIEGAAEYIYSSRLRFRANLSRNFNTSAQLQNAQQDILQGETLAFSEDLRRLQNLTASDVLDQTLNFNSDLQDLTQRRSGLARSNTADFAVVANAGQNDFTLRVGYDDADFGFQETETISLNGAWNRRLSRKLDAYARGSYQYTTANGGDSLVDCLAALATDPATAGLPDATLTQLCQDTSILDTDTQTLSVLGGFGYRVYQDISAFIQYGHTNRSADSATLEFKENAITIGLTFDF